MANTINLAKIYIPILDEVYKEASLTAAMDTSAELIREGYNANEIIIPMIAMDGLGDYSRNDGYVKGDVTLTWETVKAEFDRGRKFQVDDLDNIETGGVAFGRLAGEFIRTKVVPELDAYRFAKYAQTDNISVVGVAAALTTGAAVIAALRAGTTKMDEDEVPMEGRILYITPTLGGLVDDLDTTKSRAVLARFASVVLVPQTRFYTAITQYDGHTSGQEAGGYIKGATEYAKTTDTDIASGKTYYTKSGSTYSEVASPAKANLNTYYEAATDINFMIIHPSAVIQANKIVKPKILNPDVNPDGDQWVYGYRLVSIASVYENKTAGIYLHKSTT